MSTRTFDPFVSNASTNTRSDSARSTRPPTFTSHATAAPTYTSNEPATTSAHSRFAFNDTRSDSVGSTRAPTYTSDATPIPTNSPNESISSAHSRNESVRAWNENLRSVRSVADDDTVFDDIESSLIDTVSVTESSMEIPRPRGLRYIYYRIYAEDGVILTMNPVYSDDPYLGRILARHVAPPHTVGSLRRCLSSAENIDARVNTTTFIYTSLFITTSSESPMDDSDRMSILAHSGPGHTANEPVALVCGLFCPSSVPRPALSQDGKPFLELMAERGPRPFETQYLYYQVYKNSIAVKSKQPAHPDDSYVGRISVDFVSPPHTAKSIIRCISKIEELCLSTESQLFTNISSESPIGEGHVSILTSDRPGFTPEDPMAFVTVKEFTKRMRAIQAYRGNSEWLSITPGEILRTTDSPSPAGRCDAVNAAGRKGFVHYSYLEPC
ncbi:hypothetical protein PILCRDRAFT_830490 [Piloderma croceum F 1598]|uniref:SH3 domain-containing protein n=1 Tax=Piloderma croceum (strain F 1598) TaxID=765440 RepID=A0A0C3B1W1_PILCF|nr:hypothetical protein PILCRDRAFT_830490 [Piloderma croceum F 1598]